MNLQSPIRHFNPIYEESKVTSIPNIRQEKPKELRSGNIQLL